MFSLRPPHVLQACPKNLPNMNIFVYKTQVELKDNSSIISPKTTKRDIEGHFTLEPRAVNM